MDTRVPGPACSWTCVGHCPTCQAKGRRVDPQETAGPDCTLRAAQGHRLPQAAAAPRACPQPA